MRQSSSFVRGLILLALIVVLGLIPTSTASASDIAALTARSSSRYIVVFEPTVNVDAFASQLSRQFGLNVKLSYEHALLGIAAEIPDWAVPFIERHPLVKYVTKDYAIHLHDQIVPTGIQRVMAPANPAIGINGQDDVRVDVDVAIIDTGIDLEHPDLNVVNAVDCPQGWPQGVCVPGGDDDHFHGTHIAGIIGALDNGEGTVGIAPGARLWAVKALDSAGEGSSSWLIAALDYVTQHADEIEVANLSLGCVDCNNPAQDEAIANAVAAGVTIVVSAGNEGHDASRNSPANHPDVITVSAIADFDGLPGGLAGFTCYEEQDDTLANFSNYGAVIDIAAPGVCITSTYPLERGGIGTISGTSMAAPHVAGAAALLAASGDYTPAQIRQILVEQGTYDWVDDSGDGIHEPLLNVSNAALFAPRLVPGSQTGTAPAVRITSPVDGATVSGAITLAAEASDTDGIAQVEFFVDDASVGIDADGSDGWGVGWDSAAVPDGPHTIRAIATDTTGESSEASVSVTVANNTVPADNPPSVSIISPANGATVSGVITVSADAADDQGVVQVEFFVDGASLGVDADGSNGWAVEWNTATVPDGEHSVSAVATDTVGQTTSAGVQVTVRNEAPVEEDLTLSAKRSDVWLWSWVELSWSGAKGDVVMIWRNGLPFRPSTNNGFTVDMLPPYSGAFTYKVCEIPRGRCSNEVTAAPAPIGR
ncbi:MAG: S8 family serine peptidase [Chloroflexi bacterium]|nr:S8 family serine peptidase [Chloroflexota bacterium]